MENIQEEAARIAAEATQLAEQLASVTQGDNPPAPANYSSSVSSTTVDETTGVITLQVVLYPGDTPIEPAPENPPSEAAQEAAAAGQVPAE